MSSRHAQRGQITLIGTLCALAVLALILSDWAARQRHDYEQSRANAQGAASAQFGIGIRGYIAAVQGGTVTMPGNPYTVTGVNFLKPPTCGGLAGNPTAGFVPCNFTGGEFGPDYHTTITQTASTEMITSSTWFTVGAEDGQIANSAANLASMIAFATLAQQTPPLNGMFFDAYANAAINATAQPNPSQITPANRGRVVLYASNAPSNDIWLRVDGTNQMLADLNMGGNSIKNALNGSFAGSVRVQGTEEIDDGLSVTKGTADLRGGVITPDVEVSSVGHMASQALYNMEVVTGQTSYTIPKPDCSEANDGDSTPAIYVAMQGTGTPESSGGDALYEAHANVVSSGNDWIVTPVLHATKFTLTGGLTNGNKDLTVALDKTVSQENPTDQVWLVMTKCK